MRMRRWLIMLGVCVLVVAGLATAKVLQIRAAIAFAQSFPEPSAHVEAVVAAPTDVGRSVTALGEVIPPQSIELRNELEGRVSAVPMVAGGQVAAGDLLLQLDISEETAQLQAAQARLKLARLDLQRVDKLFASKSVSAERVDQSRADVDIAEANVRALQSTIARKTLRAPFAAIVGLHELEVGQFLQANSLLTRLLGLTPTLWVDFNMPVTQALPAVGSAVSVQPLSATAAPLPATIIARESLASASSRNVRFRAELPSTALLPPHALVRVSVPLARQSLIVLPVTAVMRDSLGDYVFVLDADTAASGYRARRQPVVIAAQDELTATLASGLQGGERVATNGAFKLRDHLLTYIAEPGQTAGPQEP